ncbi:MAG: ATP-dependent Clp protease ATP-binding subunit ClpX [Deltaproteobacteria bacterium]|nr:ATP-dependent Clp protease ATP-binding subunit ClpX [Deltaproteobacteria bacterium]MBU54775.1 ATP-dependent Clp protease ATP-binding subunit ClpX [Deltaproteobacteria bacterium]|tara:strand:+ start:29906 stop:31162 length:1257 start_codon:yes stop_codon:yes gene_type:complete
MSSDTTVQDKPLENDAQPSPTQTEKSKRPCSFAPTPREIYKFLSQYVISQDLAKKKLSVAVYNHYQRIDYMRKIPSFGVELNKSNVMLIGPSGSGKTLLAQTLARCLHVPFAIADATSLTEAGYMGEDVEHVLVRLYQSADEDPEKTEKGIIYIDEIDKLAKKSSSPSLSRDVSGEGVQQSLLKILEGTIAHIPKQQRRKHPQDQYQKIDTSNILFICGGAFVGLEDIIAGRLADTPTSQDRSSFEDAHLAHAVEEIVGQSVKAEVSTVSPSSLQHVAGSHELLTQLLPEDLIHFGMLPEFVGRLPVLTTLEPLDVDALQRILREPKNSLLRQYGQILSFEGVSLSFTDCAVEHMAQMAIKRQVGARGLRMILEDIMLDIMFELPSMKHVDKLIIDKDTIEGKKPPHPEWSAFLDASK